MSWLGPRDSRVESSLVAGSRSFWVARSASPSPSVPNSQVPNASQTPKWGSGKWHWHGRTRDTSGTAPSRSDSAGPVACLSSFGARVTETQVIFRGSGIGGGVGCKLVDAPELGKGRKELDARRPCARPPVQPCADGRPGKSNTRLVKEGRSPSATCPRSTGARWRSGIGDRLHTRRVAVHHASMFPPAIDVSAAFKMERPSWSSCRRGLL